MARQTSTMMKTSLIQKEARRTRCCRKSIKDVKRCFEDDGKGDIRIPRRWYSQQINIAETTYPTMKSKSITSCTRGYRAVSNMLSKIKPQVPTIANMIERVARIFSPRVVFLANRPLCRSHRSERNDKSRKTVVTADPAMKRGLRFEAPTAEM